MRRSQLVCVLGCVLNVCVVARAPVCVCVRAPVCVYVSDVHLGGMRTYVDKGAKRVFLYVSEEGVCAEFGG